MTNSQKILLSLLIFIISYIFFLLLWLQIKDSYGKAIATIASNITSFVTGVEFKGIRKEKEKVMVSFVYNIKSGSSNRVSKKVKWFLIDIELTETGLYTFNTPLTFAIMGGLFLFIKRRTRACLEAAIILFVIHLLHVFSMEIADLSSVLVKMDTNKASGLISHPDFLKSFWFFVDVMVIRFGPFLIGVYLYLRFAGFKSS